MKFGSMFRLWLKDIYKYKIVVLVIVFVIICGHCVGDMFYKDEMQAQKQKLMETTIIMAASLDIDELEILKKDVSNEFNPIFVDLNARLKRVGDKVKDSGIIWTYTMYVIDNKIIFSLDSSIIGDPDYQPPGEEYQNPPQELLQLIKDKKPIVTNLYIDEYGEYISAFVPILNEDTGDLVAIVGSDIEYKNYFSKVKKSLIYPLLSTILAVILVILMSIYYIKSKKINEELKESLKKSQHEKDRMELLFSEIGQPVIICDQKRVITNINKAGINILDCNREQIEGKTIFEIFSVPEEQGSTVELVRNLFHNMINAKGTVTFSSIDTGIELISNINGKRFQVIMTLSPIVSMGKIVGYIGTMTDISHIFKVDKIKSDFISLASHQLRTPLSKIRWMIEILLDDKSVEVSSSQKQLMENIYEANQQLISLVTSLLNVSRIESGRIAIDPIEINLIDSLKPIINLIKYYADQKNQQFIVEIDNHLPRIEADFKLVGEIYKNLLRNAVKYTPKKGKIILKIVKNGDKIISEISDNGYGIPENAKKNMFQKFFRADNIKKIETDGSGLGLYLAKTIVESSGGKIWYESTEGKGSTFWFSLPIKNRRHKEGSVTIEDNDNKV